ncbi:hypothetical protein Bca52824_035115 [Brassica carinata]|uniref:Uncharacterized protein n=1 Tax=Brassica carinata TaxID=52824 RepID=A0A8X7S017_BRACI|nr:hypothetical protein Bca52824_035115 [Brassica carinata]
MDEDFLLTDFSLEDIDFDFNIYEETNVSPVEASIHTQRSQFIDHQVPLNYLKEMPKPVVKTDNKPRVISFDFSSNVSSSPAREDIIMDQLVRCGTKENHVLLPNDLHVVRSFPKFIALSALLPGLKKAHKITVLDDAISRLKQLQEQIRKLNEEKEATRHMESMILVNKSKVFFNEEASLSSSSSSDHEQFDQQLPKIEAKVAQNEVLIRIHCEKSKGSMIDILNTIENLQLLVENSIVLPFGNSILDITVLAQMGKDFSVSALKDLVRNLRLLFFEDSVTVETETTPFSWICCRFHYKIFFSHMHYYYHVCLVFNVFRSEVLVSISG